jgi:RNA polymerase subunit RPABC4/transcription elongation factor Spt4
LEETIARLLQVFVALAGAYLLALWFALAIWTYRDITSRTTNAVVQIFSTLLAVLFFAPGAIIYLILRPRETLDEAFQRSIEEEYLVQDLEEYPLCPSCRRAVRDDFVYCPHCHVELRGACDGCRRLIDLRWEICPYCGVDQQQLRAPVPLLPDVERAHASERVATNGPVAIRPQPTLDRPEKRPHGEAEDEPLVTPLPTAEPDTFDANGAHVPEPLAGVTPAGDGAASAAGGRRRGSARRRAGSDS